MKIRRSRQGSTGGHDVSGRIILTVSTVQAIIVVDVMVNLIAAPQVGQDLGASGGELQLLFAAYSLAVAIGMVPSGLLGDVIGRNRMLRGGLMLFAGVSILAACVPNITVLIVCRALAGLAAATLTPQILAILQTSIPVERRAHAFGIWGLAGAAATIVGHLGGGALLRLDLFGLKWRTGFVVIGLMSAIAVVAFWSVVPAGRVVRGKSFDVLGIILLATGLSSLIYPLAMGRTEGWPAWMFGLLGVSAVLLPSFAYHEWRLANNGGKPLLDVRLLLVPTYRIGLLSGLVIYGCVSIFMFLFTIFVQIGLGMDPLTAGALFSVNALGFVAGSMFGSRRVAIETALVGAFIGVVGLVVLATEAFILGGDMSTAYFVPGLLLTGISQGAVIPQLMRFTLSDVRIEHAARAGAAISTVQQAAGAFLVATIGSVFFWLVDGDSAPSAYAHSFAVSALCVAAIQLIGVWLIWRLRAAQSVGGHTEHVIRSEAAASVAAPFTPSRAD